MSALSQAAKVYNRINDPNEVISESTKEQYRNNKQRMTPEMRLLQDHYRLLGEQDAKQTVKLDPSQHRFNCRCSACDKTPHQCPIPECTSTLTGQQALNVHLGWHARQAKKERQMLAELHKSGALSLLKALLGDPKKAATLDVRALREFDRILSATRVSFGQKRLRTGQTMRSLRAAIALYEQHPNRLYKIQGQYPAEAAILITRLALLCGAGVSSITSALTILGLGALSDAFRMHKTAPAPYIDASLRENGKTTDADVFFPSAESNDE